MNLSVRNCVDRLECKLIKVDSLFKVFDERVQKAVYRASKNNNNEAKIKIGVWVMVRDERIKMWTHDDTDGYGCRVLAELIWDSVDVEHCNYKNIDESVQSFIKNKEYENFDQFLITDISVSEETAEMINSTNEFCERLTLMDHHDTAMHLRKYYWAIVLDRLDGRKTCGTEICYKAFFMPNILQASNPIADYVELVRLYDTWDWKELNRKDAVDLNDLLYILGAEEYVSDIKDILLNKRVFRPSEAHIKLLEIESRRKEEYIIGKLGSLEKGILPMPDGSEHNVGIVFAERYASELGNRICEANDDLDFAIIINMGNKTASMRSVKNKVHLGQLASGMYGGGGHPQASGFTINQMKMDDILGMILTQDSEVA